MTSLLDLLWVIEANNRSNKMAARGMHLVVSGKIGSWACRVACGNSRAILAGDYPTFMKDGAIRCGKCANSKQASFFARKNEETQRAGFSIS